MKKKLALMLFSSLVHALYYSQPHVEQDKYLNEHFFHNKRDGVFVDIGAYDGVTHSNTYFFEKELGWRGICFEPISTVFEKLVQNRSCICVNGCAADCNGHVPFIEADGYIEMLSGMLDSYDPRQLKRVDTEKKQFDGSYRVRLVPAFNITEKLLEHGFTRVDYLSLDTEGSELLILKALDFDRVAIHYITVENNYNDSTVRTYLEKKGFCYITRLYKQDDVYVNPHFETKKGESHA